MLYVCSLVAVDSSLRATLLPLFHPGWVSTVISNQMMGLVFVNTTDKEHKILEWPSLLSLACFFECYVYKSEDRGFFLSWRGSRPFSLVGSFCAAWYWLRVQTTSLKAMGHSPFLLV